MFNFFKKSTKEVSLDTITEPLMRMMNQYERELQVVKNDVFILKHHIALLQQCTLHVAPQKWAALRKGDLTVITGYELHQAGVSS